MCLLTNENIKHIRGDFHSVPWVMHAPGFGTWGCWGQKFYFLNMVMWHIKLKGMSSRPRYTEKFYPRIKLVTLGWGQRIKYHKISSRAWGFVMAHHQMCSSFFLNLLKSIVPSALKTRLFQQLLFKFLKLMRYAKEQILNSKHEIIATCEIYIRNHAISFKSVFQYLFSAVRQQ